MQRLLVALNTTIINGSSYMNAFLFIIVALEFEQLIARRHGKWSALLEALP